MRAMKSRLNKIYTKRTNEMKYEFFQGLWRLSSFHGCDILHLSSPEALHPSNEGLRKRITFTDLLPQQLFSICVLRYPKEPSNFLTIFIQTSFLQCPFYI
mmetsp:Transcript_8678/g.13826  ORF Transcript_8678/g.13826 Transcript_8678/m.13826 type:complete len:100 (-) Transcript_8678:458-757(-)